MVKVGLVGWRGMVGSVMINRMLLENDFNNFDPFFFSTSQIGRTVSITETKVQRIEDSYNIKKLSEMNIIVSCQGSTYTRCVHNQLRSSNWKGYWIDTAAELRMKKESIIVLDPINEKSIKTALLNGISDYIGGNCTVSLMLMALHGLIKRGWVEWITSMTYQAISGAGSTKVRELLLQMLTIGSEAANLFNNRSLTILEIADQISTIQKKNPTNHIAANLIPWIDILMENGQTREEWKGFGETNKILGLSGKKSIRVDGQCVRIGTIRCHSQALTVKLKKNIPMKDIETAIINSNKWVKLIENTEKATFHNLNPAKVSGTLDIPIGRLRRLNIGDKYLTAFTVGDQLLWGAAEPIRRTLLTIIQYISHNKVSR